MTAHGRRRLLSLLARGVVATEIPATRAGHRRFVRITQFRRERGGSDDWMYPNGDPYEFLIYRFEMSDEDLAWEGDLPSSAYVDREDARASSEAELFSILEAWHLSPAIFGPLRDLADIPA